MEKKLVNELSRKLSGFGKIKSKSMFGGFGIFCNNTMFGLVVENKFYIRASKTTEQDFISEGLKPYQYIKRGFPIVTKYYGIKEKKLENKKELKLIVKESIELAEKDKKEREESKYERLKDLPNLRVSIERMLKKSGIDSVEALRDIGSVNAYIAMKNCHGDQINIKMLWSLEGAIRKTHCNALSKETKEKLQDELYKKTGAD